MDRFKLLYVIALLAIGLLTFSLAGQGDEPKDPASKDSAHFHHGPHMECAKACDDCARMCDACGVHCAHLVAEGKKEHMHTQATCQDCATHCSAASRITARHGPFSDLICQACAEACKRCGEACDKYPDDEMMKKCAEECRKCEKACRNMLKQVNAPEGSR